MKEFFALVDANYRLKIVTVLIMLSRDGTIFLSKLKAHHLYF